MDGLTVKQLAKYCLEQIKKGNGDKVIQITQDDEGNGYHTLFYQFTDNPIEIKECYEYGMFHDNVDVDNVVLLG